MNNQTLQLLQQVLLSAVAHKVPQSAEALKLVSIEIDKQRPTSQEPPKTQAT